MGIYLQKGAGGFSKYISFEKIQDSQDLILPLISNANVVNTELTILRLFISSHVFTFILVFAGWGSGLSLLKAIPLIK